MKIDVAIPKTKIDFFTYQAQEDIRVGDLVLVPLRNKSKYGIVININSQRDVVGIKEIKETIAKGFIYNRLLKLYKWMADYYLSSLGDVLRLALPSKILKKYDFAAKPLMPTTLSKAPKPTYYQSDAIRKIFASLDTGRFEAFLLYGITGSGKTEVYLRCVEKVIQNKGRALVLVPEISMTPLIYKRFKERFPNEVVTIHSTLTEKERRQLWHAIKQGVYRIVIGPRSTIFIPIPDLKLIIVDEEHDSSYKEHTRAPYYNARDVAVMRGKFEDVVVVLGSATPQIESFYNTTISKYKLLNLRERIDARPMPSIEIIDLKKEVRKFISPKLETKIEETLKKNEQIIVFLNRRGFAPSLVCPFCGFTAKCPFCNLPLVYHRAEKEESASLSCHICGHKSRVISICPKCGRATLLYRGAGTQRIEEMMKKIAKRVLPSFEAPVVLRLDRDSARKRGQITRIFKTFEEGRAKILLGTQLVTKGFDFPQVTLVGIVNADIILHLPDFRSGERTFQVLTQVAGRAGRGEKPGQVLIQTFHPEQYSLLFSQLQDYPKFYAQEMNLRKELGFPPFSRLVLLRLKGNDEKIVWSEAKKIYELLKKINGLELFGPNRSYYYKIRKSYRVFMLIKIARNFPHTRLQFLKTYKPKGCDLAIDVDPLEAF